MPDTVMTAEPASDHQFIVQGPRQRSNQWGALMAALAKAQGEIEGAKKDAVNPHFDKKYADLASVWSAIREPLSKNGLAIMQWPRVVQGAVEIETIVAHGEQFISDVLWMPCGKMDAHGIGSAITYGRRYALMAVAGVAPEDDDGNGAIDGHKPGAPGSAGAGDQFRSERRSTPPPTHRDGVRQASASGARMAADEPEAVARAQNREKGKLQPSAGVGLTAEERRAAKIKKGVDDRVEALKSRNDWTKVELDQFWDESGEWIAWMADPENKQIVEYQRFTDAFAHAEKNVKEVA